MVVNGQLGMAVATMLCVGCYLRPGELLSLRRRNLQAPAAGVNRHWGLLIFPQERAERSKTGASDDSVVVDNAYLS